MRRLYAAAALAAMMGFAAHSNGLAQQPIPAHYHTGADCPVCVAGPHAKTVTRTTYGTKEEPFCLSRLSLSRLFSHRDCSKDCGPECVTRSKTQLVKYEIIEERVQVKCAVEKVCPPPKWLRQHAVPPQPPVPAALPTLPER
jgi:hypothetical protein